MNTSKSSENNPEKNSEKTKTSIVVAILGAIAGLITATTLLLQAGVDGWVQLGKIPTAVKPGEKSDVSPLNHTQPIGWIRLGSVPKELFSIAGIPLQAAFTSAIALPITITPNLVPKVGDQVTISNSVHVRESYPQTPGYDASQRAIVSSLSSGDTVVIHQIIPCPDKRLTNMWAVWAEVSLLQKK